MSGGEGDRRQSSLVYRKMSRCSVCKRWWSTRDEVYCPCGEGTLVEVDMDEHMKTVPLGKPEPGK